MDGCHPPIIFHRKGNKMRFNYEAYSKVYPKEQPKPEIESAVDTFKPTEAEAKATDQPGEDVMASVPATEDVPTDEPEINSAGDQPEGGNENE